VVKARDRLTVRPWLTVGRVGSTSARVVSPRGYGGPLGAAVVGGTVGVVDVDGGVVDGGVGDVGVVDVIGGRTDTVVPGAAAAATVVGVSSVEGGTARTGCDAPQPAATAAQRASTAATRDLRGTRRR